MAEFFISSNKYSLKERQTKRGKVYDVIFRVLTIDGIERQKRLCGYSNKTLAKQGYLDFITEKCELVKNNPIKKKKRQEEGKEVITIEDLSKDYFLSIRNQVKDSSIYDFKNIFKTTLLPRFSKYQLKDLTSQELVKWQDELWSSINPKTNDYYSYKYLSKIRTCFSSFLTWCANRNPNFVNYLLSIKRPKRRSQKKEMQFWTRKEFDKFIAVVDNTIYKTFFSVLFFTGRRKGEVLALSSTDVKDDYIIFNKSLTRKTLDGSFYKITSTKTEKVSNSPICKPLKEILNQYEIPKGKFYFGGDRPLTENTVRRAFNSYCAIAQVRQIRIHDLRHSFVSMLIHLGANLTIVADLIGDTLEQVTKTYAHLYEEDRLKIVSKII